MGDLFISGGGGSVQSPTNPSVVGNLDYPYMAAILSAGNVLTTSDLSAAAPGEWAGLQECAVEFLVLVNNSVPTSGTLLCGPESTAAGPLRQWQVVFATGGALQFQVARDFDGAQISSNATAALQPNRWYHVVATILSNSLYIALDGVVTTGVSFGGGGVRAKSGIAGHDNMFAQCVGANDIYLDEWALYRHGLSATRIQAHYDAARNRGFLQKLSGARIGDVLDAINSHAPRSIQAGARQVIPRYMSGQSPLEEIRMAVEADDVDAGFFVAANGTLTFLADGHRSASPYDTVQVTFGDAGGSELPYLDLDLDYSLTDLVNKWSGIRTAYGASGAPVTQTVSDATSISRYFERPQVLSDIPAVSDSDVSTIVTRLLAKYKDAMSRITSISFDTTDAGVTEALFRRELMDKVRILRTPPGGGARIQQDVYIQKIDIQGANDGHPWTVTWGVSPL